MTSTSSASPTDPGATPGAAPAESPEQLLRRESERITKLLQARRRATLFIGVVFVFATVAAVVLLAGYVRNEGRQIRALGTQLGEYQAWRTKLDDDRAR